MGKSFYKNVLLSVSAVVALTACSKKAAQDLETINLSAIQADSRLSATEKAEKLALISEQLFTITNFMHADEIASMALNLDAKNKRAQFYKGMTGLLMNYKGLATRIKPSLNAEQKQTLQSRVDAFPDSALKTFLLEGQEDLKSEKDLQVFIDGFITSLNEIRTMIKNNKDLQISLNANDWSWNLFLAKKFKECVAKHDSSYQNLVEIQCPLKEAARVKLNAADLEVMQQAVSGYQLLLSLYNAYDVTGVKTLSELPEAQLNSMSSSQTWAFLSQFRDFGVYRASAQREKIIEMGLDYVMAFRWAIEKQKELCPKGASNESNREGFLLNSGICIEQENPNETDKNLKLVELILNGGLVPLTSGDNSIQTTVKPSALITNPIADLKLLKPTFKTCTVTYPSEFFSETYSYSGVVAVADSTLNGVFPGAELNEILKLSFDSQCEREKSNADSSNQFGAPGL